MSNTVSRLSTMETLIFLKKVPLFQAFELEELLLLKQVTMEETFAQGELIIRENQTGKDAYIIVDGRVEIFTEKMGEEIKLATLDKTGYFGEMSIIENEPRSASARALTECLLLTIKGAQFREMMTTNAELSFNLVKVFSQRIRDMNQKTK